MAVSTVAPLGTCRIFTPLRLGSRHYPLRLQTARNYGFVHTSAEVLQQLHFIRGQIDIPESVRRLIFRRNVPAGFFDKKADPADFYFVEISSRKLLTVDDRPIQINYLGRHFSDFFADRARTRAYWSMAKPEKLAARREMLKDDAVFKSLPKIDRELLECILRHDQTDEEIRKDMAEIAALIGKDKLVFITHVNALTEEGTPILRRQALIETVSAGALALGVPCYDPTVLMREFGQTQAMERGGLDLTHYTESFSTRLCADWFDRYIAPHVGAATVRAASGNPTVAALAAGDRVPAIEALWERGDLCEASRRVRSVLRRHPDQPEYRLLLARMQCALGDYESVVAQLGAKDPGEGETPDPLLMRAYFGLGRYEEARHHANALLAEESETSEILHVCAVAAEKLGDDETALDSWKQLFRMAGNSVEAATAALRLLSAHGDPAAARRWADEVRCVLPSHGPSFAVLWHDGIKAGDRTGLLALAGGADAVDLDEHAAFELVKGAAVRNLATPAAALAIARAVPHSQDPQILAWLSHQASTWRDAGLAAINDGRLLEAADLIQAGSRLAPTDAQLVRARRTLEQRLRQKIRAAFVAKAYDEAGQIADFAHQVGLNFPGLDGYRWRIAEVRGDSAGALNILRRLADDEGASLAARVQLARVALRSGAYVAAIDAYHKILQEHPDDKVRAEARQRLDQLAGRAVRAARRALAADHYDEAWQLLDRAALIRVEGQEIQREKKRVLARLYSKIRALRPDDSQTRSELGQTILRLDSQDPVGLKAAAVGAMRLHHFDQALVHWGALRETTENPTLIDSNIRKCTLWLERENRKQHPAPAGMRQAPAPVRADVGETSDLAQ